MKPIKITERNIMFTQPMTREYDLNLGLILAARHNFVIDTGLGSGSVAPVLEYIAASANAAKPIVVINTHSHWDHIWGNHVFKDGLIISHKICRELQDKYWDDAVGKFSGSIDGEVRKCIPNMVFDGSLQFCDDGISIFYTPGHTDNCISVYDAADKLLYAGDNIGDTEDEIVPVIGTDMQTMQGTIDIYKQYDFDICISGHNKPQTKAVLARMEAALASAWARQKSIG